MSATFLAAAARRAADAGTSFNLASDVSTDALDLIVGSLADPLSPQAAVALQSTCKALHVQKGPLEELKQQVQNVKALCSHLSGSLTFDNILTREQETMEELWSCERLCSDTDLRWGREPAGSRPLDALGLDAAHVATLAMIIRINGLQCVSLLSLDGCDIGDEGVQSLCKVLLHPARDSFFVSARGRPIPSAVLPFLRIFGLGGNQLRPRGAEALAAVLEAGALPSLEELFFDGSSIGNQGVAALVGPLRKRPDFRRLSLVNCDIDDDGVTALVANLAPGDFKSLWSLALSENLITDAGTATLVSAIDSGGLPKIESVSLRDNHVSMEAEQAVTVAVNRARADRQRAIQSILARTRSSGPRE